MLVYWLYDAMTRIATVVEVASGRVVFEVTPELVIDIFGDYCPGCSCYLTSRLTNRLGYVPAAHDPSMN